MNLAESFSYAFGEVAGDARRVVTGVDAATVAWRPDAEANSIGWLVWHLARTEDSHITEIAGRSQLWNDDWAQQLGLPAGYDDTGYGHDAEEVGRIRPAPEPLLAYVEAVTEMVRAELAAMPSDEFDRIIDASYDPPVSVGVRLNSVLSDALQHIGQAAYVRGMYERANGS